MRLYAVEKYSIVEYFRIAVFFLQHHRNYFCCPLFFNDIVPHFYFPLIRTQTVDAVTHRQRNQRKCQTHAEKSFFKQLSFFKCSCKFVQVRALHIFFFFANSIYLFLFCIRLSGKNCDRNGQDRSKGCPLIPVYFY